MVTGGWIPAGKAPDVFSDTILKSVSGIIEARNRDEVRTIKKTKRDD